jgi:ligand-binding SRPBCC domain-containing protein
MPRIELETRIQAPIQLCFDAARDIGLHVRLASNSGERAVAGRIQGLIGEGEWVSFRARHFGVPFELSARVTQFEAPRRFVDEQVKGPFARLKHTHEFESLDSNQTLMRDVLEFNCPFGMFDRLTEPIVERHLRGFLIERSQGLKAWMETERAETPKANRRFS